MKYVLLSSAFLAVSAVITSYIFFVMNHDFAPISIFKIVFVGFAAGVSCTLGLVFLFISTQPVSRHFDAKRAFIHFLLEYGLRLYGKRRKARFDVSCERPRETQEILLQTFLKAQGKQPTFEKITSRSKSEGGIDITSLSYLPKGIPIYVLSFNGSEGLYGVNLDPFSTSAEFVALINCCVFEFIPEENISESNPDTLFIDEVEVGKKYEMVITGESGLYRYRVGDVVEITGYYHKTPKINLSTGIYITYGIGTLLNMVGEKVSSDVVRNAVRDAVSMNYPDVRLVYQAVAESNITIELSLDGLSEVKSKGSHYIFFLELEETSRDLLSEFNTKVIAESIDNNLYSRHRFYQNFKDTKQIHPSTVYIVHPGAFYKLRDYVIANSTATANQFKMLEKLRTEGTFELMFKNRIIE
ncbi:putative indole-3-acetic acid-amido synthetase GH3.9 [Apostichopus japonicus]|uniref:Putative indole-3-acetic acid-amido synthetase GH3.9 n=1 Tax=Stichopus japonicus TaxID=307972 RepID=A0A2G8KGB6_STIJA|nr:putative indole-3-acetic acid-amido synthetase GH3.9 [Apostichopus japonicus]